MILDGVRMYNSNNQPTNQNQNQNSLYCEKDGYKYSFNGHMDKNIMKSRTMNLVEEFKYSGWVQPITLKYICVAP